MFPRSLRWGLLSMLLVAVTACGENVVPTAVEPAQTQTSLDDGERRRGGAAGPTIVDIAVAAATDPDNPEFTILVQALQAAELVDALNGRGQFTVFAPTDAAFGRLLDALGISAEDLLGNKPLLTDVLLYHVARGRRLSDDVLDSDQIRTLNGGFVFPVVTGDGAFIVDGSEVTPDAQLLAPDLIDIEASNGVIHVIDEVLLPGEGSGPGGHDDDGDDDDGDDDDGDDEDDPTIADIVAALASDTENPEFTILLAALQAADLVGALDGEREFTVFAPTDAAFGRLLDLLGVSADDLLASTELLTAVLLYHVAPGERFSDDVLDSSRIRTLNGAFLFPRVTDEGAFIVDLNDATEDAQLLAPDLIDIEAENGVIHVIDEVLLPS